MLGLFLTTVVVAIGYFFVYPLYFSRLSPIPGPFWYKLSKYFNYYDQWSQQRNEKIDKLHSKYGQVVQVGPNEIVLNNAHDIKEIYLKKNLNKSPYYAPFTNFGEDCLFSMVSSAEHLKNKKLIYKPFTKTAILSAGSRSFLLEKVSCLVEYIRLVNSGLVIESPSFPVTTGKNPIETVSLFRAMAMDVVTGYEYGTKMSSNCLLDPDQRKVLSSFREGTDLWFFVAVMPELWNYVVSAEKEKKIGVSRAWMDSKFEEAYQMISKGDSTNKPGQEVENLLTTMWDQGIDRKKIASEITDHVMAGHETTATTLVYLVWQLSRPVNYHLQNELFEELKACDIYDVTAVDKLPLLQAIFQECLRLHAATSGSQPRMTVKENEYSVTLANGLKIDLPPGTIVSVQPWSIQRKAEVFSNPNEFHPKRWLKDGDETEEEFAGRLREMNSHMFAWGQGNRMCIGQNIAVLEVKLALAMIYSTFNTKISSDWCPNISASNEVKMGYHGINRRAAGDEYIQLNDIDKMSFTDTYSSEPLFGVCWMEFFERE